MMTTNLANAEPVNARLLDVATGKIPHLYAGLCPDINASPISRDPECPACQVISAAESIPKAVEMMERLSQQQAGTHPAPCARSCEANAYEIEIRRLKAEIVQLRSAIANEHRQGELSAQSQAILICARIEDEQEGAPGETWARTIRTEIERMLIDHP